MIGRESRSRRRVREDAPQCRRRMHPYSIESHDRPARRKRRRSWRLSETMIENVHNRASRQPVVEIARARRRACCGRSRDTRGSAAPETGARGCEARGAPPGRARASRPTLTVAASAPRGSRRSIDRSMRCTSTIGCRVKSALPKHSCFLVCRVGPSAHS